MKDQPTRTIRGQEVEVLDNGGRTADRYIVRVGSWLYTMSADASAANGVCQSYGEVTATPDWRDLGVPVDLETLSDSTRRAIRARVAEHRADASELPVVTARHALVAFLGAWLADGGAPVAFDALASDDETTTLADLVREATAEVEADDRKAAQRHRINRIDKYPELTTIAERIADEACYSINRAAGRVDSKMPYKAQAILEYLIPNLQRRV